MEILLHLWYYTFIIYATAWLMWKLCANNNSCKILHMHLGKWLKLFRIIIAQINLHLLIIQQKEFPLVVGRVAWDFFCGFTTIRKRYSIEYFVSMQLWCHFIYQVCFIFNFLVSCYSEYYHLDLKIGPCFTAVVNISHDRRCFFNAGR